MIRVFGRRKEVTLLVHDPSFRSQVGHGLNYIASTREDLTSGIPVSLVPHFSLLSTQLISSRCAFSFQNKICAPIIIAVLFALVPIWCPQWDERGRRMGMVV